MIAKQGSRRPVVLACMYALRFLLVYCVRVCSQRLCAPLSGVVIAGFAPPFWFLYCVGVLLARSALIFKLPLFLLVPRHFHLSSKSSPLYEVSASYISLFASIPILYLSIYLISVRLVYY